MASSGSSGSPAPPAPKILLAKPGLVSGASVAPKFGRGAPSDDDAASLRPRLPPIGSLNLLSDSWEFHFDRFLPFLTENTDFTVIGVIGPAGVGKSTILNQLYGFDPASPGMLPPFATQSDDTRAMAKHCSNGIEPRVSADRLILLDTQPVFSPSVLAEMIRPDGSSTIPVLGNESVSAELAHEIMSIQLGVLLSSICHILLIVSEGVHDNSMWRLMLTVDLLKHGIPDPSSLIPTHSQTTSLGLEKEYKDKLLGREEYMAAPVFVHTKLHDQVMNPRTVVYLSRAFAQCFSSSSFMREKHDEEAKFIDYESACTESNVQGSTLPNLSLIPSKNSDDSSEPLYESYNSALWKLRDQVLSMSSPTFTRTVSERDWLRNSAKIWELVKNSSIIAEYAKTLQNSGTFRRGMPNDWCEAVTRLRVGRRSSLLEGAIDLMRNLN